MYHCISNEKPISVGKRQLTQSSIVLSAVRGKYLEDPRDEMTYSIPAIFNFKFFKVLI